MVLQQPRPEPHNHKAASSCVLTRAASCSSCVLAYHNIDMKHEEWCRLSKQDERASVGRGWSAVDCRVLKLVCVMSDNLAGKFHAISHLSHRSTGYHRFQLPGAPQVPSRHVHLQLYCATRTHLTLLTYGPVALRSSMKPSGQCNSARASVYPTAQHLHGPP